jgi:hypothetical protein
VIDLAGVPFFDRLLGRLLGAAEAALDGVHHDLARLGGGGLDLFRLAGVHGRRLLADDVLARLEGGERDRRVQEIRQAVADGVDVLVRQQFFRVRVLLRLRHFREHLLAPRRDQVRHRDDLEPARPLIPLDMLPARPPAADDADTYLLRHAFESFPRAWEL